MEQSIMRGTHGVRGHEDRWMELRQLRHFVAVVDSGNLSFAARKVHLSQPALTRSIRSLEDSLGTPLFSRSARGTAPTAAGERFYQYARMILNDCQRATDEMRTLKSGVVGNVAIGLSAMFANYIGDVVVDRVAREFPGLNLSVTEGYFEDLLSELQSGRLDLLFTNIPFAISNDDLILEPLIDLDVAVIAAPSHPLARRKSIAASDLAAAEWITVNQPHSIDMHDRYFSAHGLQAPQIRMRVSSLPLVRSLLVRGTFVAFLPRHVVEQEVRSRTLLQLNVAMQPVKRRAGLLYVNRPFQSQSAARVMQLLREECMRLATGVAQ
jgi:DNA-binding transcriptional LysR family regulator